MQSSPASHHCLSLRFKFSPPHPDLKHHQSIFLCRVTDQVSHPYKTAGTIVILYILIFKFFLEETAGHETLNKLVVSILRI
jgi:hypothetical protein